MWELGEGPGRRYPQIYETDDKLMIDPGQVVPSRVDFRQDNVMLATSYDVIFN